MSLPTALYSVAQVRAFDEYAIRVQGISGYTLMKRAGDAALRVLRERWPQARHAVVLCGAGNNGGDGYVLARLLRSVGFVVEVLALVPVNELRGDARLAADEFLASGGRAEPFNAAALPACDVIVDALLGTGFRPPVRTAFAAAIGAINAAAITATGCPVLALDLPSGLDGDSGRAAEPTVHAAATISFVALKQGLFLNDGPTCTGALLCNELGTAPPPGEASQATLTRLDTIDITAALPTRGRDTHKGQLGRVLIVGGNNGMPGAVVLAGEACLRAGAGLVTVATLPAHASAIAAQRPELMCRGIVTASDLAPLIQSADVIAIGPGLGLDAWARDLLTAVLASGKLLVLDADALNLVATGALSLPARCVLTPHPGEAARLLGYATAQVQADRLQTLGALVARFGATVVLKGAGSLLGAPQRTPAICDAGNPGMATAGMGDVLTGAIAGVLAQCRDPWRAARAAVLAHARAGDALAARQGERGLLAGDLAVELTRQLNGVRP
jgi:ADP-dependent NAD(P)H-hydrate dehydratase / NAD(P)H-hydrate epimerase